MARVALSLRSHELARGGSLLLQPLKWILTLTTPMETQNLRNFICCNICFDSDNQFCWHMIIFSAIKDSSEEVSPKTVLCKFRIANQSLTWMSQLSAKIRRRWKNLGKHCWKIVLSVVHHYTKVGYLSSFHVYILLAANACQNSVRRRRKHPLVGIVWI